MQGRVDALIADLRDFRMRSEAADELVAMGGEVVSRLLEALDKETNDGARWAILNCLGEIGAHDAVPAIAKHLSQDNYQSVAHDALVRITGLDLGPLEADWLRWLKRTSVGVGEEPAEADEGAVNAGEIDDKRLVELSLQNTGASWDEEAPGRYAVGVPLAGRSSQAVSVVFGGKDHEGSRIVVIYSLCGEAKPDRYEAALRRNLRMPYGAVALKDIDGKPHFVMFNTILRRDLSPVELRKSILTVGERSHQVEKEL